MTTPGQEIRSRYGSEIMQIADALGWTDEARTHTTEGLVNGRPALGWEAEVLERARVAARDAEVSGLFSGMLVDNPKLNEDNGG